MIQVIERRRVDRRISERRRSTYNNAYAVGIYRCDCCDYDAASRSDDINYHFTYLVHSIVRIFHQLVDCGMEFIFSLIGPNAPGAPDASANSIAVIAPTTRSSPLLPTAAQGTIKAGKKNSRTHASSTTRIRRHFSFLKNIDWKDCIYEYLHLASQALALVATLAGGIVFAATALMFATFPGKSETGDFHEAMERAYRRKTEEERKRRLREEEELEREEEQRLRDDEEDDEASKVRDEMGKLEIKLKQDGSRSNAYNNKAYRENDRKIAKLEHAADDVLDGKYGINHFEQSINDFRTYQEERDQRAVAHRAEGEKHYRQYLEAYADASDLLKRADKAAKDGKERESRELLAKYDHMSREADDHYRRS